MRSTSFSFLGLVLGVAASVTACGCDDDGYGRGRYRSNGSSIVFGISESKDPQTGKIVTKAGHEYLSLANRGGSKVTVAEVSHDDVCIHEQLDRRIGRPHVGDGGRARFTGGAIPGDGLLIDANGPEEPKLDGQAFRGEPLTFGVDFGFALPEFGSVRLPAPNANLEIDQPSGSAELAIDVTKDASVAWSPSLIDEMVSNDRRERFMVSYETDDEQEHGTNVRCFYDEKDGAGVIPSKWLSLIGPSGTKGTITFASHRQVEVFARGGWLIYVVGTVVLREQRFVVQ